MFTSALFPLTAAQLSLDYDMEERQENYLSMDPIGRELMTLNFPPMRQLQKHMNDTGTSVKVSQFNVVEFGLLAALVFFNPQVPNLQNVSRIRQINEDLKMLAYSFITQTYCGSNDLGQHRLNVLMSHVDYLGSLNLAHQSLMIDFAQNYPHLVDCNPLHLEMFTSNTSAPEQSPGNSIAVGNSYEPNNTCEALNTQSDHNSSFQEFNLE